MSELNLEPQWLCESSALQECDGSFTFEVLEGGQTVPAFAVRFDNAAVAYLNRCAHVPAEMDWQAGQFWDMDKRFIVCSMHGALYEPADGLCVSGPCPGKHLIRIDLIESQGQIHWQPTDRFQPLF